MPWPRSVLLQVATRKRVQMRILRPRSTEWSACVALLGKPAVAPKTPVEDALQSVAAGLRVDPAGFGGDATQPGAIRGQERTTEIGPQEGDQIARRDALGRVGELREVFQNPPPREMPLGTDAAQIDDARVAGRAVANVDEDVV